MSIRDTMRDKSEHQVKIVIISCQLTYSWCLKRSIVLSIYATKDCARQLLQPLSTLYYEQTLLQVARKGETFGECGEEVHPPEPDVQGKVHSCRAKKTTNLGWAFLQFM